MNPFYTALYLYGYSRYTAFLIEGSNHMADRGVTDHNERNVLDHVNVTPCLSGLERCFNVRDHPERHVSDHVTVKCCLHGLERSVITPN